MTLKPHQIRALAKPLATGAGELPPRFFVRFKGELLSAIFSVNK